MPAPISPPRGMRDVLPAEKVRRERALAAIRGAYRAHGFDEIETPVLEDAARLSGGLGGDNEKLAFGVLKRGLTTADLRAAADADDPALLTDLGLRFDLTVPLARFYASHRAELPAVFRAIQIAPVWRAERPQKGRYRQFVQCDIDVLGEAGPLAEIELVAATLDALDALRVTGTTVRLNDRRLLTAVLAWAGVADSERDAVLVSLDKLDKVGADGVIAELAGRGQPASVLDALGGFLRRAAAGPAPATRDGIVSALPDGVAGHPDADAAVEGLALIAAAVATARGGSAPLEYDPVLVRGMGYYTGTIFEIAHPGLGYSLGGGGRYDGMIGRFLGADVPAAGFSLGFERIVDLLEHDADDDERSIVLVHERDADPAALAQLKVALAGRGERVLLVARSRNLKIPLARAAEAGYRTMAAVGDGRVAVDELERRPLA